MEEKEDIVPELLENIREEFQKNFGASEKIRDLYKKIQDGSATYKDAYEFAENTGTILAQSFEKHLSSSILPEGKMYYNIADRILHDTLKENYDLITDVTSKIQKSLNKNAGIGIKPIVPELNQDRIDGLVNKISSAENYDDVAWVLDEPVKTFSLSVVDDSIKKNAEFHSNAGLCPKIIRKSESKCCKWCRSLAGSYTYPDNVPDDVYRRHENCRCTVDYHPGDGKIQNVHSKQWRKSEESDKIKKRKKVGLNEKNKKRYPINPASGDRYIEHSLNVSSKQFGKKAGKHLIDYGLDPASDSDREILLKKIHHIFQNADERCYGEWRHQEYPVIFHILQEDVVVEDKNGNFITILKGGIENERVKNARKQQIYPLF